ncbi:MAG TPA: CoA transferase [Dehalococcoidia bacterium]|nr:CoA transferase [Dehalococcoidia bacterium]
MSAPLPLAGLRVLDLGHYVADPYATRILADYGAEVIKVETARRPDMTRKLPPYAGGVNDPNRGGWFMNANYNKLGLTLNLGHPGAGDLLLRLVGLSDVVSENFSAGVLERLGLGYETLRTVRPDIILIQMPGYGRTGPYSPLRAVGPTISAFAGIDATIGWPDGPPLPTGRVPVPDYLNALGGVIAVLAAVEHRARTGEGQHIELSQHENTVATQGPSILQVQLTGTWPERNGNRDPVAAPQGVFRCRGEDAWCAVSVQSDDEWQAFCRVADRPDLTADPRFATAAARRAHQDEAEAVVAAWTAGHSPDEAMGRLQAAGIPAGAVRNSRDLTADEQLASRGYFDRFERPDVGAVTVTASAARFSETPAAVHRPAPRLGQDNDYILRDLLGLTGPEVERLIDEAVIA